MSLDTPQYHTTTTHSAVANKQHRLHRHLTMSQPAVARRPQDQRPLPPPISTPPQRVVARRPQDQKPPPHIAEAAFRVAGIIWAPIVVENHYGGSETPILNTATFRVDIGKQARMQTLTSTCIYNTPHSDKSLPLILYKCNNDKITCCCCSFRSAQIHDFITQYNKDNHDHHY